MTDIGDVTEKNREIFKKKSEVEIAKLRIKHDEMEIRKLELQSDIEAVEKRITELNQKIKDKTADLKELEG